MIPKGVSTAESPTPDLCKMAGVAMAPAAMITSYLAYAVYVWPVFVDFLNCTPLTVFGVTEVSPQTSLVTV